MLVVVGMILLLAWTFEHAFDLSAGSLVNLLLIFASISFALDIFRERDTMNPRPGWDHRPPRLLIVSAARAIRRRFEGHFSGTPRQSLGPQKNQSPMAKEAYNPATRPDCLPYSLQTRSLAREAQLPRRLRVFRFGK